MRGIRGDRVSRFPLHHDSEYGLALIFALALLIAETARILSQSRPPREWPGII